MKRIARRVIDTLRYPVLAFGKGKLRTVERRNLQTSRMQSPDSEHYVRPIGRDLAKDVLARRRPYNRLLYEFGYTIGSWMRK